MRLPFVKTAALAAAALFGAAIGIGLLGVDNSGPMAVLCAAAGVVALITAALTPEPAPRPANTGAAPQPVRGGLGHVSIEALAYPVVIIDAQRRVALANAEARALMGERILGEDVRIALRHPAILDAEASVRAGAPGRVEEIHGFQRAESVYRLRAAALEEGRVLLGFVDITQARLAERMRVDFVANASHELRTPLSTLLGFIETLQGPAAEDEPARQRFLEIMEREARRMSRLIDDLLSLSRIELDKFVPPRGVVDLAPAVTDVARALAPRLDRDRRVLDVEIPADLPAVVGDRDQIMQVLHNLISNALKYGRLATPIRLRAETLARAPRGGQPMVRVSVEDEGDGIAPEHLPRLTERFYRVDTSRSRAVGGTGLGLAIVKHIVERHRGELSITSRSGVGTVVSFTLPVSAVAGEEESEDEEERDALREAAAP
jgi:two-component system phosphate regulon sensor histidine kinase PhoR